MYRLYRCVLKARKLELDEVRVDPKAREQADLVALRSPMSGNASMFWHALAIKSAANHLKS